MTLAAVLAAWNLIVFAAYGIDKRKAKKGSWRTPEKTLLAMAFFMGGAGALLGMKVFRHKTRHARFQILVPLFFVLNIALLGYLFYKGLI
ncbi:MAG: DUF1294 domain-containing protein [Firmicutes bacterium]|nr:DUF1294 domain-containing protein [Bacillota bacterium]